MLQRFMLFAIATMSGIFLHAGVVAAPNIAQSFAPAGKPDFSAQLIVGGADKTDPALSWLGLHVRLGKGWHTYWRSAGDAGAPPEFDWSGSRNVAAETIEWPAPHRYSDAGIDTFGYADEILLPIKLRLQDPQLPAHVALKLALYVCGTICTRNDLSYEADIAPGARFDDRLDLIGRWRAKVPRARFADLAITALSLQTKHPAQLRIEANSTSPLVAPDVFVDGDSAIVAGHPTFAAGANGTTIITLPIEGADVGHPAKPLHVTLVDGNRAVEAVLPPQRPAGASRPTASRSADAIAPPPPSAWAMLAIAMFGGLILNFMPCVFPVLSLKLFSLLGHPSRDRGAIKARFVASAVGVIVSFLLLATVLAALKSAGAQIGWGIQFQQPLFLIGMAAILVALGANLLDLYEINLPWRIAGLFGKAGGGQSLASHFFNGFITTLLATPCSAPFVGTAVGFALSQGTWQIFEIFLALGLGMASPYLVLAAVPQVGRFFPRPGRWMQVVRHIAAVAMVGTAIWLLTVLAAVSGAQTALLTGAAFGLTVWALAVHRQRFAHAIAGSLIAGLAGTAILIAGGQPTPALENPSDAIRWQPLAPQDVQAMVRSGHTVFVDVTAAWCVTCKVNETLIVDSAPIRRRLAANVAALRGDWTRPDPAISAYLQSFGRFGLPFNAVFGPGAPDGIVLPELLTQEAVLNAFNAASGKQPPL
jgi:suppressor for copper-sensitivity B